MSTSWFPLFLATLQAQAYKVGRYVAAGSWCEVVDQYKVTINKEDGCIETHASMIEVVLANIGQTTYGSAIFSIPSEVPVKNISRYQVRYDESLDCYKVCERSHPYSIDGRHMPSILLMSSSATLAENEVAEQPEANLSFNGAKHQGQFGVADGNTNIDVVPAILEPVNIVCVEDAHTETVIPPILPYEAKARTFSRLASETALDKLPNNSLTGLDWADMVEDKIEDSMVKHGYPSWTAPFPPIAVNPDNTKGLEANLESTPKAEEYASHPMGIQIPAYYVSPTGQDWADMENEEQLLRSGSSTPELHSNIPTDSEPSSPTTPFSICLSDSDEEYPEDDFENLSPPLQALDLLGLPKKYKQCEAVGQDWQTCSRNLSGIIGLNLQLRDGNDKTYRMYFDDCIHDRPSTWSFMGFPGQEHLIGIESGDGSKENASEDSQTEYGAGNSNNGDAQDQVCAVNDSLPNLRQYIPQDTTAQLNYILMQMDEVTRNLPTATQYAQDVIDWTHMCQASKDILASSDRPRRFLEQADRSVDWFWDVVKADGAKAFHHRGSSEPRSIPVAFCELTAAKPVHHYNYCGDPVDSKSATPPAVSMWFAFSPGVAEHAAKSEISMHKQVLMSNAGKYLDPFTYSGPQVSHIMKGTDLQDFAIGLVEKVYVPEGIWMDDHYGLDEDKPRCSTYVSCCFDSGLDTINHPYPPYVITAGNDGDIVINDNQHHYPVSTSKTRMLARTFSNLRSMHALHDTVSDIAGTKSQSLAAALLKDCQALIAQLMTPDELGKIVTSFGEYSLVACLRFGVKTAATEIGAILTEINLLLDRKDKKDLDHEVNVLEERLRFLVDPPVQLADQVEPTTSISAVPVDQSVPSVIVVQASNPCLDSPAIECIDLARENAVPAVTQFSPQELIDTDPDQYNDPDIETRTAEDIEGIADIQGSTHKVIAKFSKDLDSATPPENSPSASGLDLFLPTGSLMNEESDCQTMEHSSDNSAIGYMSLDGLTSELEIKILEQSGHPALQWRPPLCESQAEGMRDGLPEERLPEVAEARASDTSDLLPSEEVESNRTSPRLNGPGFIHEDDSIEANSFFSTPTKQEFESWLNEGGLEDQKLIISRDKTDEELVEIPAQRSPLERPQAALGFRSLQALRYTDDLGDYVSVGENDSEHSGINPDEYSSDNSGVIIYEWPDSEIEVESSSDICVKVLDIGNNANDMPADVGGAMARRGCDSPSTVHSHSFPVRPRTLDLNGKDPSTTPRHSQDVPSQKIINGMEENQPVYIAAKSQIPEHVMPMLASVDVALRPSSATKTELLKTALPKMTNSDSLAATTDTSMIIGDDEFADDSDVEDCVLSQEEVDIRERAWMLRNPDCLQPQCSVVEHDIPNFGNYYGVDFGLLDFEETMSTRTHTVPDVTIQERIVPGVYTPPRLSSNEQHTKALTMAIATPLPPATGDEDEETNEQAVQVPGQAEEQGVENSEPLKEVVYQPAQNTKVDCVIERDTESTPSDCKVLFGFPMPYPTPGDCLLYGSIAVYVGHRIYSAFRR